MAIAPKKVVVRHNDVIGYADATDDTSFLSNCFVDNDGEIDILSDPDDPRCIILGRTGSGKTALATKLSEQTFYAVKLIPEEVALQQVSNSSLIRFVEEEVGAELDVLYKLLWRHVFAVEIIKRRFDVRTESDTTKLDIWLDGLKRSSQERDALNYVKEYGDRFWQSPETRVKEITETVEKTITGSLDTSLLEELNLGISGERKLSTETKKDINRRVKSAISSIQARKLNDILVLTERILDDPQKQFLIFVDKLDETWVDDGLRYKLIKALIECCRDFNSRVSNIKCCLALRLDLLKRVYYNLVDPGFQEEKYESLYISIRWSKTNLIKLVDKRIDFKYKSQYTNESIMHTDILPPTVNGVSSMEYILNRTLLRPRDVILFINECLSNSNDSNRITPTAIEEAETNYSRVRLRSIYQEWKTDYPYLELAIALLKKSLVAFPISAITEPDLVKTFEQIVVADGPKAPNYSIHTLAMDFIEANISYEAALSRLFSILWSIGIIGIRNDMHTSVRWATSFHDTLMPHDIDTSSQAVIHPAFQRALGTRLS